MIKNKKGEMTFNQMILAVLAIFLIVLLLWKTGTMAGALEKFGGKAKGYIPGDNDFVAFEDGTYNSEEGKKAIASTRAAQCSINIVSSGDVDYEKYCTDYKEPRTKAELDYCRRGAMFDDVCVVCTQFKEGAQCDIYSFELSPYFENPNWILYYEAFPKGEEYVSNEALKPKGANNLVLSHTSEFGNYKTFEVSETENVYPILTKPIGDVFDELGRAFVYKEPTNLFYLKAPCKADVVVQSSTCSCDVPPRSYLLDEKYPIRKDSINVKDAKITQKQFFYELNVRFKNDVVRNCRSENKCFSLLFTEQEALEKFVDYIYKYIYLFSLEIVSGFPNVPEVNLPPVNPFDPDYLMPIEDSRYPYMRLLQQNENVFASLLFIDKDKGIFIDEPLNKEDFKNLFIQELSEEPEGIEHNGAILVNSLNTFSKEFTEFEPVLESAAAMYYVNYYSISKVDASNAVKVCDNPTPHAADQGIVFERLDEPLIGKVKISVPCVTLTPDLTPYGDFPNNKCYD